MPETFERTTASVAAWNLAGFGGIDLGRMTNQTAGIRLLDAEVVTLVEIPQPTVHDRSSRRSP